MKYSDKTIREQVNRQVILAYIVNNNLTEKEFCRQCQISIWAFYKITNGRNFNLISLFKIAKKMNTPIHTLFK